jgi:hypothetical protein
VSAVHIDIIETLPSLAKLEDNWNAVYDADDEAQIYLSWQWLSGWLSSIPGPWFILAAKERDDANLPYVGFFPLRLQTTIEKSDVFGDVRIASGPPVFVNRMVRRWISRQAFGTERFSAPAE